VGERHTNDLGEYRLFDLMPGHYYIRVKPSEEQNDYLTAIRPASEADKAHARGYVTTYYPGVADSSRATEIDLKPGDEISAVDITLVRSRTYNIHGRVIDQSGLGVGGRHTIKVLPEAEPESTGLKDWEDANDGSFEIDGLVPGNYMVAASALEENAEAVSGFARVTVTEGDLDSVSVVINRPAVIHGRIAAEGGPLPEGLAIELSSRDNAFLRNLETEVKPNATFEFPHLNEGIYQLAVIIASPDWYLKWARMNGVDILAKGLEVSSHSPGSVELVLSRRAGTIDVVTSREDGSTAPDATVLLVPDPPFRERSTRYKQGTTDIHGETKIRGVAPGGYRAFAFQTIPDSTDVTDPDFILPFEFKGERFSLDESEKKTLHLKLISIDSDSISK
jgi:protocatechuate 3,4-dioxygenase beta subunit